MNEHLSAQERLSVDKTTSPNQISWLYDIYFKKMYYLCSMAKKTSTFDYEILVRDMLPKGILDTFEVAKVEEECTGVMDETNTEIRILQTLSFKLCR